VIIMSDNPINAEQVALDGTRPRGQQRLEAFDEGGDDDE